MAIINHRNIITSGFDEDALTTTMSGEHVRNFGRLTTTGDLANGIFADASNASIRNFGQIETSGLGAAGIFAEGEHAHIENFGSVVTHGEGVIRRSPTPRRRVTPSAKTRPTRYSFNDLVGAAETRPPRRVIPPSTQNIASLLHPPFTPLPDRSCEQ